MSTLRLCMKMPCTVPRRSQCAALLLSDLRSASARTLRRKILQVSVVWRQSDMFRHPAGTYASATTASSGAISGGAGAPAQAAALSSSTVGRGASP